MSVDYLDISYLSKLPFSRFKKWFIKMSIRFVVHPLSFAATGV